MIKKKINFKKIKCFLLLAIIIASFPLQTTQAAIDPYFASDNYIEFAGCGGGGEEDVDSESNTAAGAYIKLKGIPEEGIEVGASVFGGKTQGGKWVANWADNGGNDLGNHGNHLTGTASFAELGTGGSIGNALGGLPNGSKIEIEYKGKKIIAVKADVGTGGPDVGGKQRAVDLWWETANLLGFQDGTDVVKIHAVAKETPTTSVGGKAQASKGEGAAGSDGMCCEEGEGGGDGKLMGDTREEQIWNYLTGRDGNLPASDALTPEQAAGLMGNLHAESGLNPGSVEKANGIGFGIAQWSYGRRTSLEKAAKKKGVPVDDLKFQLDYLVQESKARAAKTVSGKEWAGMQKQKSVDAALVYWHDNFERSADSAARVKSVRGGFADKVYKKYKNKTGTAGGSSAGASGGGGKTTVFIDPGHGGAIAPYTDKKSGLRTSETPNMPEGADVLDVSNRVKSQLEAAGYKVEMARTSNSQKVKFRDRADAAAKAKAAIGISIHTTPGEINEAWPQRVGTYRKYGSHKDTFTNKATAAKSEDYASAIAEARTAAEGHKVNTDPGNKQQADSFNRAGIQSKGNIALVELWSPTVPWVYNEIAQDKGEGISDKRKKAYAKGIVDGILKAVPAGDAGECAGDTNTGGLAGYILKYAWPKYRGKKTAKALTPMPAYKTDVIQKKVGGSDRYIGGIRYPGIDCGGFTTNLFINSGYDPKYNYGGKMSKGAGPTGNQAAWARKNWEVIGSGSSVKVGTNLSDKKVLRQGDVAISADHTFMYAGKIEGFGSKIASASLDGRAPMAGEENPNGSAFTWYRKK